MSVEFKVVWLGSKVVSVSTSSPHLPKWEAELPLVSREVSQSSQYEMPDDQAKLHYNLLKISGQ